MGEQLLNPLLPPGIAPVATLWHLQSSAVESTLLEPPSSFRSPSASSWMSERQKTKQ